MAEAEAIKEKSHEADNMLPPGPPPKPQPMTPAEPPQLNVRPVTQFAPDLTPMGTLAAGGAGAGATLGVAAAGSRNLTGNASPPHTPQSSVSKTDPFGDPVNPFGNQAEAPSPVAATGPPSPSAIPLPQSPLSPTVPAPSDAGVESALGAAATGAAVAGGVAAVAAVAAAKLSDKDLPGRPDSSSSQASSVPEGSAPSPVSAVSADPASIATATAVAAVPAFGPGGATGPPPPGPSNVHRVQMDFQPSMEDELELRAGQLVRLLHEYDDGWALCVRLDRSQQGVVPRSCLSARPVKPRARPPPGAGPGPVGPMGPPPPGFYPHDPRPRSPSAPRPMSPAQHPHGGPPPPRPYPQHPMSPAQFPPTPRSFSPGPGGRPMPPRSMSPGPYGPPGLQRPEMPASQRKRSNSAGGLVGPIPRSTGSPGPSPLAGPMMPPPSSALPAIPTPPPQQALVRDDHS